MPPMAEEARVQISRQCNSVDVEDLRIFLSNYAQVVTVREVHPGPEMNVDWFLQATLDVVLNYGAAHPFVVSLLGSVSGYLTSATAKKIYEKFGDALIEKTVEKFFDQVAHVYKRAKKANVCLKRGDEAIPVPPLRIRLELNRPKLSDPTTLALTFPYDLTDTQVRDALMVAGKVVETAIKKAEKRRRYEERARKLIVKGKSDDGTRLLTDEKYIKLRRTPAYAYRPDEKAWIDAWVLADQAVQEESAARLREAIKNPPPGMKGHEKAMRRMVAGIEKDLREGRVR
jgi:hypothetical protein